MSHPGNFLFVSYLLYLNPLPTDAWIALVIVRNSKSPSSFYYHCWSIFNDDLVREVHNFFADGAVRPHQKFTQGLWKVKETSIEDEPKKTCIQDWAEAFVLESSDEAHDAKEAKIFHKKEGSKQSIREPHNLCVNTDALPVYLDIMANVMKAYSNACITTTCLHIKQLE